MWNYAHLLHHHITRRLGHCVATNILSIDIYCSTIVCVNYAIILHHKIQ